MFSDGQASTASNASQAEMYSLTKVELRPLYHSYCALLNRLDEQRKDAEANIVKKKFLNRIQSECIALRCWGTQRDFIYYNPLQWSSSSIKRKSHKSVSNHKYNTGDNSNSSQFFFFLFLSLRFLYCFLHFVCVYLTDFASTTFPSRGMLAMSTCENFTVS